MDPIDHFKKIAEEAQAMLAIVTEERSRFLTSALTLFEEKTRREVALVEQVCALEDQRKDLGEQLAERQQFLDDAKRLNAPATDALYEERKANEKLRQRVLRCEEDEARHVAEMKRVLTEIQSIGEALDVALVPVEVREGCGATLLQRVQMLIGRYEATLDKLAKAKRRG